MGYASSNFLEDECEEDSNNIKDILSIKYLNPKHVGPKFHYV